MWRDDAFLLDMLLAAREIRGFTEGFTVGRFLSDRVTQHAVMRLIQNIGEAARSISPDFQQAHPEIPWRAIIGMRNRLVHEYFRIIPEKVWEAVKRDLPRLVAVIKPLVPPDESRLDGE
jgi:uncharacterized protein with HEPN domain